VLKRAARQAGMSECGRAGRSAGGVGSPTERDTGGLMYQCTYRQVEIYTHRHIQMNRHTGGQCESAGIGRKIDMRIDRSLFTHTVHTLSIVHMFVFRFLGVLRGTILRELSKFRKDEKILFLVFGVDLVITYEYFTCLWYCLSSMC
jgi:hypothetical protein